MPNKYITHTRNNHQDLQGLIETVLMYPFSTNICLPNHRNKPYCSELKKDPLILAFKIMKLSPKKRQSADPKDEYFQAASKLWCGISDDNLLAWLNKSRDNELMFVSKMYMLVIKKKCAVIRSLLVDDWILYVNTHRNPQTNCRNLLNYIRDIRNADLTNHFNSMKDALIGSIKGEQASNIIVKAPAHTNIIKQPQRTKLRKRQRAVERHKMAQLSKARNNQQELFSWIPATDPVEQLNVDDQVILGLPPGQTGTLQGYTGVVKNTGLFPHFVTVFVSASQAHKRQALSQQRAENTEGVYVEFPVRALKLLR